MSLSCAEIAARIHADMVNDEDNGYSWEPRHGEDGKPVKTLTIDGKKYSYDRGSWDCSSSVIKAWSEAIKYTPYKGKLDGATYTGNMRSVFTKSGLFEWKPMSFIAARGDLYLDEANHVAMCQSQEPDVMSEFCINERGEVYGGRVGDQTGAEAAINPFREVFDGILHYNGKADGKEAGTKGDTAKKQLFGIDVSSNQPEGIVSMVPNDFAIVKVSGNPQSYAWDYVNPYAKKQAADAMKRHGRLGLYHFTWGKAANTEADFFVEQVRKLGYVGKAVLVIDYEAEAVDLGRNWVKRFAQRIKERTGVTPVIYASGSVIVSQELFGLGYPIWCANYSKGYQAIEGYSTSGCTIYGGCEKSTLWQYTSQGFLDGYDGALDCNVFFGTSADWLKLAAGQTPVTPAADDTPSFRFRVYRGGKWQAWHTTPAKAGVSKQPIYDIEFKGLPKGSWWRFTLEGGRVMAKNAQNTSRKSAIIGVELFYKTANPSATGYYEALYRVHTVGGGWLKWEHDVDDGGAGDDAHAIDVVQFKIAKV